MIDVLAGLLSGSQWGPNVKTYHQLAGPTGIGVFLMALDIERFMPLQQFKERIESYITSIKKTKKGEGVSQIYLPGEIELEREKQSLKEGVEISAEVAKDLNTLLEKTKSPLRLGKG
jgi:LDH2 family malate/lactate/ureidoglycolate dehydrogenase